MYMRMFPRLRRVDYRTDPGDAASELGRVAVAWVAPMATSARRGCRRARPRLGSGQHDRRPARRQPRHRHDGVPARFDDPAAVSAARPRTVTPKSLALT